MVAYFILAYGIAWGFWLSLAASSHNLLHITTTDGPDSGIAIRGLAYLAVALLSMVLVKVLAERLQTPEVKPWGQWDDQ